MAIYIFMKKAELQIGEILRIIMRLFVLLLNENVVALHYNSLDETVQMRGHNYVLLKNMENHP